MILVNVAPVATNREEAPKFMAMRTKSIVDRASAMCNAVLARCVAMGVVFMVGQLEVVDRPVRKQENT